jgi:hypothetical protein
MGHRGAQERERRYLEQRQVTRECIYALGEKAVEALRTPSRFVHEQPRLSSRASSRLLHDDAPPGRLPPRESLPHVP